MLKLSRAQAGDTLIEVLFAITTFSLVVVTSLAIMNQGTAASMRSLQITLVRQEIDSQAETLRYLSAAYVNAYYDGYAPNTSDATTSAAEEYYKLLADITTTSASKFGGEDASTCPAAPDTSFILNARTARYGAYSSSSSVAADTFSQVIYNSDNTLNQNQGIWVEPARPAPEAGKPQYIDFHIRACWSATGSRMPMNLGTIVRLYEPTS
jgi:type II secretory pathway pseudopilin PulG